MGRCEICGTELRTDLFAFITREPCCAICKVKFIGGLPTTPERVASTRTTLGLNDGEFLSQGNGAEAATILGRS